MPRIKRRVIIRPRKRKDSSGGIGLALKRVLLPFAFFAVAGVLGLSVLLWRAGWFDLQYHKILNAGVELTRKAGFSVQEILVEGRGQTDRDNILQVLGIKKGSPILAFDPKEALQRLTTISWVKSGTVERRLPSTIYVRLKERTPMAIWQNNQHFYLIDQEGHVLREMSADETLALPHVVGAGADSAAADLLAQLVQRPTIFSQTRAAVRVGQRRWDLHMLNGVVVKLPEENTDAALERLSKLIAEQNILERNIVTVDMRLPDRLIVDTNQPVVPPKASKPPPHI